METAANNAGAVVGVFANKFVKVMGKQLPSVQEEEGDDLLNQARELVTDKVQSLVCGDDLKVIEEKITYVREMKIGLNTKSGFRKYRYAREYHKLAKGVYRHVKFITERAYDQNQFHPQRGTLSEADEIHRTARSLYRCWLSCVDAFPSSLTQDQWVMDVWNQACSKTGTNPNSLRQDEEVKYSSMKLLNDMKTKTKPAVESFYGFDTSQAPKSIGRNSSRAQKLLAHTIFIYRELDSGGCPHHPYQHPIIQKIINITWFQNKDDVGIVFHELFFDPIPFEAIAIVLTVIECCIDEWSTGTYNESSWKEERYKTKYSSHLNSLRDLYSHGVNREGEYLLKRIQHDLLRAARTHAGATPDPDPPAGSGSLSMEALNAAVQGYLRARFESGPSDLI